MKSFVNRPDNADGRYCRIIIGNKQYNTGISLMDIRYAHVFEFPQHNAIFIQATARAIRNCSNLLQPFTDRKVTIYTYITTIGKKGNKQIDSKNWLGDGIMFEETIKNQRITDNFINTFKAAAIDCKLFQKATNCPK